MIPAVAAADLLAFSRVVALVLVVQPQRDWRGAATHSRAFWLGRLTLAVGVGVAGAVRAGPSPPGTTWLGAWVARGGLQPSMLADLIDARRDLYRCRTAPVAACRPARPALPPTSSHALARVAPPAALSGLSAETKPFRPSIRSAQVGHNGPQGG